MPSQPRQPRHEIPTHLDVQDTLLLGLTVRQSLHLLAGLAASLAVWRELALYSAVPLTLRATFVGVCLVATALLVLVRPHRRDLDAWAVVAVRYATAPRVCVWRAESEPFSWTTSPGTVRGDWAAFDRPPPSGRDGTASRFERLIPAATAPHGPEASA